MSSNVSSGRGGAGNIAPESKPFEVPTAASLSTPRIKTPIYTTGRGGSGNMAKNVPERPDVARAAQDVMQAPERVESKGAKVHHGRGGAANVVQQVEAVEKQEGSKETLATTSTATAEAQRAARPDSNEEGVQVNAKRERRGSRVLEKTKEWIRRGDP